MVTENASNEQRVKEVRKEILESVGGVSLSEESKVYIQNENNLQALECILKAFKVVDEDRIR